MAKWQDAPVIEEPAEQPAWMAAPAVEEPAVFPEAVEAIGKRAKETVQYAVEHGVTLEDAASATPEVDVTLLPKSVVVGTAEILKSIDLGQRVYEGKSIEEREAAGEELSVWEYAALARGYPAPAKESVRPILEAAKGLRAITPEQWAKDVEEASRGPLMDFSPEAANAWMATVGRQLPILVAAYAGQKVGMVAGVVGGPKGVVIGGIAGGMAPMILMEAGTFLDAGRAMGIDDDILIKYAKPYGVGSGAIEYAQNVWMLKAFKPLTGTAAKFALRALKEVGGVAWEGVEELSQQTLSNWLMQKAVAEHNARHPEKLVKAPTLGEGGLRSFIVGMGVAGVYRGSGHSYRYSAARLTGGPAVERVRRLAADERGALEVPPGEPERDLLGREVRPEDVQKGLWGERGVEAVWRTIKGVEYVLTPDGKYATRADGTGPLLLKDDSAAITADAEKAKPAPTPPAPATVPLYHSGIVLKPGMKMQPDQRGLVWFSSSPTKYNLRGTAPVTTIEIPRDKLLVIDPTNEEVEAGQRGDPEGAEVVQATKTGSKQQVFEEAERRGYLAVQRAYDVSMRPETAERFLLPEAPVPPAPEKAPPTPPEAPRVAPAAPEAAPVAAEGVVRERLGAEAVVEEEEVPFEVRIREVPPLLSAEATRVQEYLRGLEPQELVRALKRISGPYGGTLAKTLRVGKATKALATAQKKLRTEEAATKKVLEKTKAAYPDILVGAEAVIGEETSLLGILGPRGRLAYGKGVEHGTEIAEAIEGRSLTIRRHFTKRPQALKVGQAMSLEDLQIAWTAQRGMPAKDAPSLSEVLDRLMGEVETSEAARAEGRVPLEQQLRDLAANVPEDVAGDLLARAERLSETTKAVWEAHDALLTEAEPYLVSEELAAPVSAEVQRMERDAAAALSKADQALREAHAAQTLAERGVMTAAEQTKVLQAAAKLSGVPHVASILRAIKAATTEEGLEAAREKLAWALERHVKREHAHRAARMARRIESWARRQKFDPRDSAAGVLVATANETSETGLMLLDLEVVKARERMLTEGLYEYQTADELIKSDAAKKASGLAKTLNQEADDNALGRIDRAAVARADVGIIRGLPHYIYKALTTLEQVFGMNSQASKLWFEFSLGKDDESTGARAYYRLLADSDTGLNEAMSKATGLDRLKKSNRFVDWLTRSLVLNLPDAGQVELTVDEWMGLANTARDRDGNMQVEMVPLARAANRAQAPFAESLSDADRAVMLSGLDRADERILKAADVYWRWHQNKERFREWSEAWHAIKGWWPEELTDYYPLHRDIPREAPTLLRVPGLEESVTDRMTHAVREVGFMQERMPDAVSPLLIKGAELEYLAHSRTGSALVAYGVAAKNIEKVLNAGEPSFLRRLESRVGRTVARSVWVDTVRHVLGGVGLSPGADLQGNQRLDQVVHQGMVNIGTAYFVASPFTARSQLFGIFGKLSDPSSPTSVGDFLVGIKEALRHPMRYWHQLAELSPLVKHRVDHAPALYMFGDVREAQGRRRMWTLAKWWRRAKTQVTKKMFWARNTDAWTQIARYRANYHWARRQGLPPDAARTKAARMTEMDIENQDFPAHAGSTDMLSQQARRSMLVRGIVFAGQSRASQANLVIRNFNALRRDRKVGKFLKALVGVALTAVGIAATNVLRRAAQYKALRTPGKATAEFIAELFSSVLGNVHVVRQLVASVRYAYGGVQAMPVLGPVDDLFSALRSVYGLIDGWDDKKAWRAAWRMSYAVAILAGIPVAGARGMYRIVAGLMPEGTREGVGSRRMRETAPGGRAMPESVGSRTMKPD